MSFALSPITADRVGLWRRELSARQISHPEHLGRHALSDLGYPLTTSAAPLGLIPLYCKTAWHLANTLRKLPLGCTMNELLSLEYLMWSR